MAGLRDRLNALEETRLRAADKLRKLLRTISDEEIAQWIVGFRRGEADEECAPKVLLDVTNLFDEVIGDPPDEFEGHRRALLITGELLETRRAGIRSCIHALEMQAMEGAEVLGTALESK